MKKLTQKVYMSRINRFKLQLSEINPENPEKGKNGGVLKLT